MNIKKFFEYHSSEDGRSEESLLAKMEKNNKKRYDELLSKITASFNTPEEVVKYVKDLINKDKDILVYILLDKGMEFNTIYKFEIKESYYVIDVYNLTENETDNGVKFQIYGHESVGSRYESDIYAEIKKG